MSTSAPRFDPWARRRARRLIVQALYQWQVSRADVSDIENQFRDDPGFERTDATFFVEVLRGVLREREMLDALIAPLLDRKLQALDQVELALLRLGTYELTSRADVPFKVVIDEYVALARTFGGEESHRYINGVLDKVARIARAAEVAANE
jgi:transcription antitermination protein NusB